MQFKKVYLTFLLALLFNYVGYSATFIVTSNADTGPGTLREALNSASANGTTVQDIIQFNLPGTLKSDRTIRLKTSLPLITSNVVIDGTTEPGSAFGVSDSKVIIEPETTPSFFNALIIAGDYNLTNVTTGVEIYGLYIHDFAQINNLATYNSSQGSAIYIQGNSTGIIIGAPGKGNVICGNIYGIYNNGSSYTNITNTTISIQSNIIGLTDDGKTASSNIFGINISNFSTITIGGDNANMGNTIAACVTCIGLPANYYFNSLAQSTAIKNNKIGTDYTGTIDYKQNPLFLTSSFLKTYGINVNASNSTSNSLEISSNIISGQIGYAVFVAYASYTIKNNKIGTDITGTQNLGSYEGIRSDVGARGTIGGTGATDKNLIGFNTYGIEVANSAQVLISQNSIFCNTGFGIGVVSSSYTVPYVQVLTFKSSLVAGLATPNSTIELFYSDDCPGSTCQGKEYFATVQSDASGKWSYSGAINGTVIATATNAQKNTSPFSSLSLLANEAVIKQYTCAYNGSITIPQVRDGILFHWDKKEDNGTLTPLGDTQNIDQLLPGNYVLTIQYPGGCQKVTQTFNITDQHIKILQINAPIPQCRQKSFPISALTAGGTGTLVYKWINAANVTIATGLSANIPEGTYTLQITDATGCPPVTSDPIVIKAKPGPDLDINSRITKTAQCGVPEGAITGLKLLPGIGTATYSWKTYPGGVEVGTDLDLTGVLGGNYTITLYDQSECSNYTYPTVFNIPTTNSVFIGEANITRPKCGLNNGALTIPAGNITNASVFKWYGPNGAELTQYQNKLSLINLDAGTYTITATNPVTGCNNSRAFDVIRIQPDTYTFVPTVTDATCDIDNGSILLTFTSTIEPVTYTWTNQVGTIIGHTKSITNLPAGTYYLAVTDRNACPTPLLAQYTIAKIPKLVYDATNNPVAVNDICHQQIGKIGGVVVSGGVQPYSYKWTNANGDVVGIASALDKVIAGDYKLTVTDATACGILNDLPAITVGNDENIPPAPVIYGARICSPEVLTLRVANPIRGVYKLYKKINDVVPEQTNTSGEFVLNVTQSNNYYVTYSIGSCESPRTRVYVEVILVDIKMANTITPNGDGVNDVWTITGLEKFPGATVQVYNRAGQQVFGSKDYPQAFDGKLNGQFLPSGTYYYVINLNTFCGMISGNLTIVR
jgi:gliding motility-associated-like protein